MSSLQEFEFHLIKIRDAKLQDESIINLAYMFWKSVWMEELKTINGSLKCWGDEFYRHDYIGLVTYDQIPVGMHLYGLQNLNLGPCRDQSHFQSYTDDFIPKLKEANINKVISASWLCVNPDFAKFDKDIVFSKVITQLSLRVCQLLGYQGAIAPARKDNGLSTKLKSWGVMSFGEKVVQNVMCEIVFCPSHVEFPLTEKEKQLIGYVWQYEKSQTKKAA